MPEPSGRAPLAEAMRYAQAGTMLVAPMAALGAAGYLLDRRFGSGPWLLLAGLILGMAAGFVNFFRLVLGPPGRRGGSGGRGPDGGGGNGRGPEGPGPGGPPPGRPRR